MHLNRGRVKAYDCKKMTGTDMAERSIESLMENAEGRGESGFH